MSHQDRAVAGKLAQLLQGVSSLLSFGRACGVHVVIAENTLWEMTGSSRDAGEHPGVDP